jgi:hypothetical protein
MSVAMILNTEVTQVYVRLLDEGTIVFRPVPAMLLGSDMVKLLAPNDYDPEDENWEFKPGCVVHIEQQMLEGKQTSVVVGIAR